MGQIPGKTFYRGNSENGPSPAIWHDCPWLAAIEDPSIGYGFWEDFIGFDTFTLGTSAAGLYPYWEIAGTGTGTVTSLTDERHGVIAMQNSATGDHEMTMTLKGGAPFMISDAAADAKQLWFEARVKTSSIADASGQFFVGLTQEGRATADGGLITDAAALAVIDSIGFSRLDDDGDALDITYCHASGSVQVVEAAAHTLVADTFVKVGFVYNPSFPSDKKIKFFIDNVDSGSYVTAAQIATANTFPDGEELTIAFGPKDDSTDQVTLEIDWVRCFQMRV